MKALYYDGKNTVLKEDYPEPLRLPHESLIKISLAAICSTDREIMRGYKPDFTGVLGHEFVGVVQESDDATLIGKRVVWELNEGCGQCLYCKTGREHLRLRCKKHHSHRTQISRRCLRHTGSANK